MGSHLCRAGLNCGQQIWAGVRATTNRKWLTDKRLNFVEFDFDNPASLADTLRQAKPCGGWDYIVYNLGATKCLRFSDFNRINYQYLSHFLQALKEAGAVPEKLLYMSSLSVLGKGDEKNFAPFTLDMVPAPDTRYGVSKLKAETELTLSGIPYIIFRPTGIYGPCERDYFIEIESVAKGIDFGAGFKTQQLSFIYGPDLARAVFMALEKAPVGSTYLLAEERSYTQREFRDLIMQALGRKHCLHLTVPLWGVKMVSAIAEKIGAARGKPSTLNTDKYNIMRQRNWCVDSSKAFADFGFKASTSMAEGLRSSIEWYRKEGWLK